jgi:hypothetical protein
MKAFILAAIAVFCMASCKKGSNPLSPALFGKWEVRRVYNGNIYPPDSTYKPGNGNILQFNSDSTYKRYDHAGVTANGVFHIRKNSYKIDQNSYDELYFSNDTAFKYVITSGNDYMTLKPLFPDIPTTDYQKISD